MAVNKTISMEQFRAQLKERSLKSTPQRMAVHQAMLKLGHASADMVMAEIEAQGTDIKVTTASVYNILSQLALLGIYAHRLSATNKMFFDVNTFCHAHMYDCENNIFKDITDEDITAIIEDRLSGRKFRGYNVESVDIQFVVRPKKKKSDTK